MLKKILPLIIGFLCGNLFIKMLPIVVPFDLSEFLLIFILNPFEFFAASTVFIIGFMMNAKVIEGGVKQIVLFISRRKVEGLELLLFLLLLICFILLFTLGFWQTVIFFSFSLLYGMISIDFKGFILIED